MSKNKAIAGSHDLPFVSQPPSHQQDFHLLFTVFHWF